MTDVPKGAKKPADRKPKTEAKTDLREVDVMGVHITLDAAALDDFELMDDLARIEDGEYLRAPAALRRMLGGEKVREVMDALRDPDTGRVSNETAGEFIGQMFEALDPNS